MVSVRDRGIGIDLDDDRVRGFDRLHSHRECAGTGIGLSLRQRIAERRGEIRSDSGPGEGPTFAAALPTVPDGTEPTRDRDAATDTNAEPPTDEQVR